MGAGHFFGAWGKRMLPFSGQGLDESIQILCAPFQRCPPCRDGFKGTQLRSRQCFSWKEGHPLLPGEGHPTQAPCFLCKLPLRALSLPGSQYQGQAWAIGVFTSLEAWCPLLDASYSNSFWMLPGKGPPTTGAIKELHSSRA